KHLHRRKEFGRPLVDPQAGAIEIFPLTVRRFGQAAPDHKCMQADRHLSALEPQTSFRGQPQRLGMLDLRPLLTDVDQGDLRRSETAAQSLGDDISLTASKISYARFHTFAASASGYNFSRSIFGTA